jgi:hypothetical protein
MGSIALKYGVNLQDLLAANPEVDPHFMTIGKTVVIPIRASDQAAATLPTPTQVPVRSDSPACYLMADGSAWCYVLVFNDHSQALENLSALIELYTPAGELAGSQTALAPLNLLLPSQAMPLAAHFAAPVPAGFRVRLGEINALPVLGVKARYLQTEVEILAMEIAAEGGQAVVKGNIHLTGKKSAVEVVWLAVIAYGANGEVVGVRRWEASEPGKKTIAFQTNVFSLGPPIERVDALVEARP